MGIPTGGTCGRLGEDGQVLVVNLQVSKKLCEGFCQHLLDTQDHPSAIEHMVLSVKNMKVMNNL